MACHMRAGEAGFTYLGLLALVVLIGLMLAAAGEVAGTTAQREREKQLLFVGHQYRDAIAAFYRRNHRYPQAIDELLQFAGGSAQPLHFLRRAYVDPMTGMLDWTLVPGMGGGIMGVASTSGREPMKRDGFDDVDGKFKDASSYADWLFTYDPFAPRVVSPTGAPGAPPTR